MSYEQTDQDGLYIEDSYFTPDGYYVYVAEAQAAMAVTGGLSADVGVIKDMAAAMSVTVSVSATISHIEGADLFAFADAQLAIQVDRIRDINTAATAVFSVAVDAVKAVYVSAQADAAAQLSSDILRIRSGEAATSAAFSVSADSEVTITVEATLASTATITTSADITRTTPANLSATATVSASGGLIQSATVTLSSTVSISVTATVPNERPRDLTIEGNLITTSTDQKLLGTHSLYIPDSAGGADLARTNTSSDFFIPSSTDFIIEFYFDPSQFAIGTFVNVLDNSLNNQIGIGRSSDGLQAQWQNVNNSTQTLNRSATFSSIDWIYANFSRTGSSLTLTVRTRNSSTLVWSSASTATTTYSGQIGHSQTNLRLVFGQDNSINFGGYIDEFYMAKGTGVSQQFISGSPAVNTQGKESTTLALYHFDGNFNDDITGIANAAAALSSTATVSATAQTVKVANASLAAQAQQTTAINYTTQGQATLAVTGFTVTAAGRIQSLFADLDSQFSLAVSLDRIKLVSAELTTSTVLSAQALDLDLAEITLTVTTALTFNINLVAAAQASITGNAVQTTAPVKIVRITDTLTATAALTASVLKLKNTSAALLSNFQITKAQPQRYAFRPNGTWDTSIEMYPKYSQWNTVYIDDIVVPASSPTSTSLFNFGGRNVVRVNNTITIQGVTRTVNAGTYSLVATKGSAVIFGGQTYGTWDFDPLVGTTDIPSGSYGTSWYWTGSANALDGNALSLPYGSSISSKQLFYTVYNQSKSYDVVCSWTWTWTSQGTLRFFFDRKDKSTGTLTNISTKSAVIGNDPLLWPDGYGSGKSASIDAGGEILWPGAAYVNAQGFGTLGATVGDVLDVITSVEPNGFPASVTYLPISEPYIEAPSGSNLLITSTGFDNSVILSTNPYVVTDQKYILGLYNSYTSVDNTGVRVQIAEALSSTASIQALATRLLNSTANLSSNTSQTTVVNKIAGVIITAETLILLTASAEKIKNVSTELIVTASTNITANKNVFVSSSLSVDSNLTAIPYDFTKAQAALQAQASIEPTVLRIKQISAEFTAFYSELTAASKNATGTILLESTSTLICAGVITADQPLQISSQTQMTTIGSNTQFGAAEINAESTQVTTPTYLRRNESAQSATATLTAQGRRVAFGTASMSTTAVMSATVTRVRDVVSNNSVIATASISGGRVRLGVITPIVTSEFFATVNNLVRVTANLSVQAFQLSLVNIIHLDPLNGLIIEPETRYLKINDETRILTINSETRVNKIKGYPIL